MTTVANRLRVLVALGALQSFALLAFAQTAGPSLGDESIRTAEECGRVRVIWCRRRISGGPAVVGSKGLAFWMPFFQA